MKKQFGIFFLYFLFLPIPTQAGIYFDTISDDQSDVTYWDRSNPEIQTGFEIDYLDIVNANYTFDSENKELDVYIIFKGSLENVESLVLNDSSIDQIQYQVLFSARWDCTTFNCESSGLSLSYFVRSGSVELYIDNQLVTDHLTIDQNTLRFSFQISKDQEKLVTRSRDAEYDYFFSSYQSYVNSSEFQDDLSHTANVGNYKKWKVNAPFGGSFVMFSLIPIIIISSKRRLELQ